MVTLPFSVYDFFGYLASGFVVIYSADEAFGLKLRPTGEINVVEGVAWLLVAYVAGHVVAGPASLLLEQGIARKLLGPPYQHLCRTRTEAQPGRLKRLLFSSYISPLSPDQVAAVRSRAPEQAGEVLFHHVRTTCKRCEKTWQQMQTFLNLYGFCRNLSFSLLLSALFFGVVWYRTGDSTRGYCAIVLCAAAVAMLYRYLKFYRQYAYEMFTAFPSLPASPTESSRTGLAGASTVH